MSVKRSQIIFLAISVVLCTYIFIDSLRLSFNNYIYVLVIYILFAGMVVWEVVSMLVAARRDKQAAAEPAAGELTAVEPDAAEQPEEDAVKLPWYKSKKLYLAVGLGLYLLLMEIFGFFTAGFVCYVGLAYLLGTRKPTHLFLVPVLILGCIYLCFVVLFHINLPSGLLI